MQQVFNLLLLYFQLVHFYNAEKKRKSFRGKTPVFFWAFFQEETSFLEEEREQENSLGRSLGDDEPPLKMQKEEFNTHDARTKRKYLLKQ